jgi:hypothetical protein
MLRAGKRLSRGCTRLGVGADMPTVKPHVKWEPLR